MKLLGCQLVGLVGNLENYRFHIINEICTRYGGTVILPWSMKSILSISLTKVCHLVCGITIH